MLEQTKGGINTGESRDTGNIGQTRHMTKNKTQKTKIPKTQ